MLKIFTKKCGYQYFLFLLIYTYASLFRQMLYRRWYICICVALSLAFIGSIVKPYQLIMPVCDREADRLILETVKQQGPASETYEWLSRQLGIWTSEQVRSAIFWYSQHFGRVRGLVGRKVQWIEQFVCSSSFHWIYPKGKKVKNLRSLC